MLEKKQKLLEKLGILKSKQTEQKHKEAQNLAQLKKRAKQSHLNSEYLG